MTNDQGVQGVKDFSKDVKSLRVVGVKGVESFSTYVKGVKGCQAISSYFLSGIVLLFFLPPLPSTSHFDDFFFSEIVVRTLYLANPVRETTGFEPLTSRSIA